MSSRRKRPWDDRWETIRDLGAGGQGTARLVTRLGGDQTQYVLKFLHKQKDPERRGRMFREVAALRTLDSPAIPKVIEDNADLFETEEPLYVVMDFIPGERLDKAVKGAPWGLERATVVLERLLGVLEYCHAQDTVHRDLKPDNIILREGRQDDPVVLDFGLSFNREVAPPSLTGSEQQLGNRFLGLPELRTPESTVARDPRSDITSCCGILFFLLTGRQPMILEDEQGWKPHERAPGSKILAALPTEDLVRVRKILDVGFQRRIDNRWQSIALLRKALEPLPDGSDAEVLEGFAKIRRGLRESREFQRHREGTPVVKEAMDRVAEACIEVKAEFPDLDSTDTKPGFQERDLLAHHHFRLSTKAPSKSLQVTFRASVNPDMELVVLGEEMNRKSELLRIPVANFAAAADLKRKVILYLQEKIMERIVLPEKKKKPFVL